MEEKIKVTVVVWGNDNYNVLGLLRQLTPYVENVIFLANGKAKGCASKSKYCKHLKVAKSQEEAIQYIERLGKGLSPKGFLITTSDLLAECIDQYCDELSKYYYLSNTKEQGLLTKSLNKGYQYKLAHKIGINVPSSQVFRHDSAIGVEFFPCLIKPAFKEPNVKHPFKTCICNNEEDLIGAQQRLDKNGTYVLQQYIKKDYDVLIYGCRLEDGRVINAGSFTKYRWANGDGSYGIIDAVIPTCVDIGKLNAFLEETDYYGLFSAEFGVKDGIAWFYEFNLRNDGTSHYFYQAGLQNIPLLWVKSHLENLKGISSNKITATFIDEIDDNNNIKAGIVTSKEWQKQKRQATVFKYYDANDMRPYYFMKAKKLLSGVKHLIKK